jgi:DNA helicase-2/ATP-dependent DNA helicase PcrA
MTPQLLPLSHDPTGMTDAPVISASSEALNPAQQLAASFGIAARADEKTAPQPLLIIAGAGTGKTSTLAHRVANLLLGGVHPDRIALMTFSRRAALEMTRRAERITADAMAADNAKCGRRSSINPASRLTWSGTFHSVGNRILRDYAESLGLDPTFSVIDRGDSGDLIDVLRQEQGLAKKARRFPRKDTCLGIYSRCVNTQGTLQETLETAYPWCMEWETELTSLFAAYVRAKQDQQLLDYDDLLLYWHTLMQEPLLAADIGGRFDHVLVDEYQDTNTLQAEILLAMKPDGAGLCVVGDDAQSIYSFRAANVDNILKFPERFTPNANVVKLEQNYRSVQPILDAANRLMADSESQYQKDLHSSRASKQRPRYVMVEDDIGQSEYVVAQILAAREEGTALREQAVLMRRAHDSDVLEVELTRRNIPYVKYGGLKFLEAAHVKDVLALLRFADNPRNRVAGFRTLQLLPGVGPATAGDAINLLTAADDKRGALTNFVPPAAAQEDWTAFIDLYQSLAGSETWAGQMTRLRTWYEPHIERLHGNAHVRAADIEQLEALASQYTTRERFLTELTLDPPAASSDEAGNAHLDEDYLILSTVHSAKGQEWDRVFLLNVTDGNFPNEFAADDPLMIDEERRLLYVAMTRARNDLHLISPLRFYITQQRQYGGKHLYGARSRFLTDEVLRTFETCHFPEKDAEAVPTRLQVRIDAGAKMRSMWGAGD